MRVFLLWASKSAELVSLIQELNTSPHKLVYWLGQDGMEVNNLPGVIFHSHVDATEGIPAHGVDVSKFEPPNAELIEKLYKTESLVLSILNRSHGKANVDERRHFYFELLRYWHGVLVEYKPDVIIFPVDPHGACDYVVYELARLIGIRTLMFNETRVSDRLLYYEDFRIGSEALQKRIKENADRTFKLSDLSPDIQAYYEKRAQKDMNAMPAYVGYLNAKYSVAHRYSAGKILKSIGEGSIFARTYRLFFIEKNFDVFVKSARSLLNAMRPNLKKEYNSLTKQPDTNKKFIYYALQVQPERSTSPTGDLFTDQILAIEMLSAALPKDWVIYVKEHPIQWTRIGIEYSSSRYPGYYEKIARIPKVALVPIETSSFELMDKSHVVATVTGAPGWEAMLRGKPALVFGHAWYKECPAAHCVDDVSSCREAISRIQNGGVDYKQQVITYLKSLDEATIHGFIAASNASSSKLNRRENMESIIKLILKELAHER